MPSAHVIVTSTNLSSPETAVGGQLGTHSALGKGKLLTGGNSGVRGEGGLMMEKKKN